MDTLACYERRYEVNIRKGTEADEKRRERGVGGMSWKAEEEGVGTREVGEKWTRLCEWER